MCLQEFVEQASGALVGLYAELIGAVLPNISHPNPDIQQVRAQQQQGNTTNASDCSLHMLLMCHSAAVSIQLTITSVPAAHWLPCLSLSCCCAGESTAVLLQPRSARPRHISFALVPVLPHCHSSPLSVASIALPANSPTRLQVSKEANAALLNLQPYAEQAVKVEVGPVLAIISRELRSEQEPTRLEALRW